MKTSGLLPEIRNTVIKLGRRFPPGQRGSMQVYGKASIAAGRSYREMNNEKTLYTTDIGSVETEETGDSYTNNGIAPFLRVGGK